MLIPPLAGIILLILTTDWITLAFVVVNVLFGLSLHYLRYLPCLKRFFINSSEENPNCHESDAETGV